MKLLDTIIHEDKYLEICLRTGELHFIHLTDPKNIDSIKENGLLLSGDTAMFKGECLYCVDKTDEDAMTHSLDELSQDMLYGCDDDWRLTAVQGFYHGKYYEVMRCVDEEEEYSYALGFIGLLEKDNIIVEKYMTVHHNDVSKLLSTLAWHSPDCLGSIKSLEVSYR